jgi:ribosomal protein S18 acetylase RimI-like enzyme
MATGIAIRRASPDDAARIVAIWTAIVAEKIYSAVDRPFSVESEREYLNSLSPREAIFVAETGNREIIGFQSLDQWTKLFHSMDHVGQLGTFVLREWRKHGVGRQLAAQTLAFARASGYEKLVIYVRASNAAAQAFYARLGFVRCGRLVRQVKIGADHDDEIVMELLFSTT